MNNLNKSISSLLFLSMVLFQSCSLDEQDKTISQIKEKEQILNSDEFKAVQSDLEAFIEVENAQLEQLRLDQVSSSRTVDEDEPFVFFVIGDSELNMRDNSMPQLQNWIDHLNRTAEFNLEFVSGDFEEGESKKITKPELVFLAGDINKDRAFGFDFPGGLNYETKQLTNQLFNELDDDILFFPGNGNHDWDPYQYGDGSHGHNLGGLFSNNGTAQFVRNNYQRSLNRTDLDQNATFNYDKNTTWFPPITSAEFNYSLEYKGLRFTQLNQFMQTAVAMVSFESLLGNGPATYHKNRTANWFRGLCNQSAADSIPHVVVQHFPISSNDGWWNDQLGTSPNELRKEYLDIFSNSYQSTMFTGHIHLNRTTSVLPYNIMDYTAGYFAFGRVIAVKASASKGVYAVGYVDFGNMTVADPMELNATYSVPQ